MRRSNTADILNHTTNIQCQTTNIHCHTQGEKREKILEWLSPGSFTAKHEQLRKARVKDTGQWFLDSDQFRHWVNSAAPQTLLCPGNRINSLKFISDISRSRQIFSHVCNLRPIQQYCIDGFRCAAVDHLQERFKDKNILISFVYFYYKAEQ